MTPLAPDFLALALDDVANESSERWLGPGERRTYASLYVDKRRREWLAGRIAAKKLVRRRYGLGGDGSLRGIEIVGPAKRRPSYRLGAESADYCLSISHAGGVALAALGRCSDHWLGVDVEVVEPRGDGFESLLLSATERTALAGIDGPRRWRAVTRIWVVKEAVGKALGLGLGMALPELESGLGAEACGGTSVKVPGGAADVGLFELGALQGAWATIGGRELS